MSAAGAAAEGLAGFAASVGGRRWVRLALRGRRSLSLGRASRRLAWGRPWQWWICAFCRSRLSARDCWRQGGRRRLLRWAAFCIFYLVEEFSRWWCSRRGRGRCSWRPLAAHTVRFTFHTRSCVSALRRITRHERPMGEFASNVRPEILYQRSLRGQERRGYDLQRDGLPPTSPLHGSYLFLRQHIAKDSFERASDRGL